MIILISLGFGLLVGTLWGFIRKSQAKNRRAEDPFYIPKLEVIWIAIFVTCWAAYFGERLFGYPLSQVLRREELLENSFPFFIMFTILLFFSLKMTKSTFFRQRGLKASIWKVMVFAPLGALLIVLPAVEVLNRQTDTSEPQQFESVVIEKLNGFEAFLKTGGLCSVVVKSPLQDTDVWTLRLNAEMCDKIRVNITPLNMALRDGRFGIAYIDSIAITEP